MHLFKTMKTEDDFVDLYFLKKDIDINNIKIQAEEVEDVMWASKEIVDELIEQGEFLLDHIKFYNFCMEYLKI